MEAEGQGNEAAAVEQPAVAPDWEMQRKGLIGETQKERQARQAAEAKASELEAKLAEMSAWRAEAEPKLGKLSEYEQREQARAEALAQQNAADLAALPEALRALVPEGLSPEATAAQIGRLKAAPIAAGTIVRGGGSTDAAVTPEMKAFFKANNVPESLQNVAFYKQCHPTKT